MGPRAARGLMWAFVLAAFTALAAGPALPPPPTHWVTDEAGVLPAQLQQQLDERLKAYEQETGHQVVVWVGQSTGGVPLEEWAARTFAAWGVGRKKLDDGLAVFILMKDHRIRIEVGYGLEPVVTDAQAARLIQTVAVPALKAGRPDQAVQGLVDGVLGIIGGEKGAPPKPLATAQDGASLEQGARPGRALFIGPIILGLFALVFALLVVRSGRGRRPGGWGGGGWWGGGGSWGGGSSGGGGGGFSGGGGSSGGGGASGSW